MVSRPWRVRSDGPFFALVLVAGAILLYLGRSLTFWQDEWSFITFSGTAIDYLRPHNEHWSTLPLALYRATFSAVQLHSYLPYLAELVVLHLLTVSGAYVLMRRRVGPLIATVLAIPLLLLGSGAENLFWAFQTGFVGSVMFGVWALVFVERAGRWSTVIASVLVLASLMSSGIGLVFMVAFVGRTVFDSAVRARIVALVVPSAVYTAWFFAFGREPVKDDDISGPLPLTRFVVRGIAHAIGELTGVGFSVDGRLIAFMLFVGLVSVTALAALSGRGRALAIGCSAAILALYVLIGLVRPEFDSPTRSRYVYIAAFLFILAVADWVPALNARFERTPRLRSVGAAVFAVGAAWVIAVNVDALMDQRTGAQFRADMARAYVALAIAHREEPWFDPDPVASRIFPPVPVLLRAIQKYGSPLEDRFFPDVVGPPRQSAREAALVRLVGRAFRAAPAAGRGQPVPATVVETKERVGVRDRTCVRFDAAESDPLITLSVPSGTRIRVMGSEASGGSASLGREWPPTRFIPLGLAASSPVDILVPDIGDGGRWTVGLELSAISGRFEICPIRVA